MHIMHVRLGIYICMYIIYYDIYRFLLKQIVNTKIFINVELAIAY